LSIENDELNIYCEKSTSQKDSGKNYKMREIEYGYYQRVIPLPKFLDTSQAKATFKKGMLWIDIPKTSSSATEEKLLKVEQVE
jgi:HSP20 family protein